MSRDNSVSEFVVGAVTEDEALTLEKFERHISVLCDKGKRPVSDIAKQDLPTKQDIIREGLAQLLVKFDGSDWEDIDDTGEDPILNLGTKQDYLLRADELLKELDSQGLVIKVDRELPKCPIVMEEGLSSEIANFRRHSRTQYDLTQMMMLHAGFVSVEPLIDEPDGN